MKNVYMWAIIENIVTLILTFLFCKYINMWGILLLFNLNSIKGSSDE